MKEASEKLKNKAQGIRSDILSLVEDISESVPRPLKGRVVEGKKVRKGGIISILQERPLMKRFRDLRKEKE